MASNVEIQSGYVRFDSNANQKSFNSPASPSARTYKAPVKFPTKFSTIPKVVVALTLVDTNYTKNTRVSVKAEDITQEGFSLVFGTWWDSITYNLEGSWIAYGVTEASGTSVTPISGKVIKNPASGLVLDTVGTLVWANTNTNSLAQKWAVTPESLIKSQLGDLALDLKDVPGQQWYKDVVINPISGALSQQWEVKSNGVITNKLNGWLLSLVGQGVVAYPGDAANPQPNQIWQIAD